MTIITSSIMKRAHQMTKEAKKQDSSIDYRTQLGLNISFLLKQENSWSAAIKAKISFYKEVAELAKNFSYKNTHTILNDKERISIIEAVNIMYGIKINEDCKRYSNISISNIASEAYESVNNIDKRFRLERG